MTPAGHFAAGLALLAVGGELLVRSASRLAAAVACRLIFYSGYRISRWEGARFLAYYGAYAAYLILHAAEHGAHLAYSAVLMWFALPRTAVTLAAITVRERGARRRDRAGV